jgi:hypothetical protein
MTAKSASTQVKNLQRMRREKEKSSTIDEAPGLQKQADAE